MVLDSIQNAARYMHLGKGISNALRYIQDNDLAKVKPEGTKLKMTNW